jgi:hypothetical protein
MTAQIFVQIPAYRDSELGKTLLDLYRTAEAPDRLRVAVAWQRACDERLPDAVWDLPAIEIIEIPYEKSQGCNWARTGLQGRWRGEPYTLLLDSHHRFVPGWDAVVVSMYEQLTAAGVAKPVITAYLPAYDPAHDPQARKCSPYKIYAAAREQGMLVRLTSFPIAFWEGLDRPVEADFASLHFLFAAGSFNEEIRFDPDLYFFGDEVVLGLRLFTSGYDLFHPHRVVGWHNFDRATRVPHWDDHPGWGEQHRRSLDKMRRIFMGTYTGQNGLGRSRTIGEYERRIMARLAE